MTECDIPEQLLAAWGNEMLDGVPVEHINAEALTPAYWAAAEVLNRATRDDFDAVAATVVDTVRPHILAETRPVRLRDLIRAARAAGAPLRRHRSHGDHLMTEYWQCWDDEAGTRRVLVRHWPKLRRWRVEIYSRDHGADGFTTRVDLENPTVDRIAAAAELCGWTVRPGTDGLSD